MKDLIYNLASQAHLQLEAVSARSCLCNVPVHSWSMFSHGSYSLMVYVQSLSLFSVIILSWSLFSHGPYSLMVYVDSWSLFTCNLCSVTVLIIHSWSMVLIHSSLMFSHGPYSQDIPELELESIFKSQLELHLHQKQTVKPIRPFRPYLIFFLSGQGLFSHGEYMLVIRMLKTQSLQ